MQVGQRAAQAAPGRSYKLRTFHIFLFARCFTYDQYAALTIAAVRHGWAVTSLAQPTHAAQRCAQLGGVCNLSHQVGWQ
jgi:hypothetical protein